MLNLRQLVKESPTYQNVLGPTKSMQHMADVMCLVINLTCIIVSLNMTRAVQPVTTCRQSPYLHKPAIVIVTSFSLWRLALWRSWRSQPPFSLWRHSHCDVIHYWAGHDQCYGCTNVRMDTLPHLIYKDIYWHSSKEILLVKFLHMLVAAQDYVIQSAAKNDHTTKTEISLERLHFY